MGNIIQSFWYDVDTEKNGMSEVEILCALSYLAHGHDFHLYTYNTNSASMRRLQSEITKKKKT